MKQLLRTLFIICIYALLKSNYARGHYFNSPKHSPVLVELFTSEGCSSCPAADALLSKLADDYGDRPITLEFQVDYWNRLGWKDRYSKLIFSERQRNYSRQFSLSGVYTPQAVVNSIKEMVGSNGSLLKKQ